MSKKYLIMDVDTGCDDSMALMLAAAQENFEILALTADIKVEIMKLVGS